MINSTIFKTWLSDINKIALTIDELQNITQFKTGNTIANGMLLSDVAINKYKTSIEGLNLSQAKATLSATALNEAQKNQILISAGLIASTDSITTSEIKQAVAENVLTAAKQQEVLATFEQEIAEGKLSLERLKAISLENTEAGAIAKTIIAKKGENAQNLKNIASGKALNAVLKEQLALLLHNPLTWVVIAAGAIIGLSKAIDAATISTKEYEERLENLKQEFSETESELKSVNEELKNTTERLDELEEKDSLSFVEKEEYDNLVKANNELDRQNNLLETQLRLKNQEKNKAFVDTMNSDSKGTINTVDESGNFNRLSGSDKLRYWDDFNIANYQSAKSRYDEETANFYAQKMMDRYDEYAKRAEGISYIPEPSSEDERKTNEWLDFIEDYQDRMMITLGNDKAKTNAFNRVIDNWQFDTITQELQNLGEQGRVTAKMLDDPKYDIFIQKLVDLGIIDAAENLDDIALAFNKVAESQSKLNNTSEKKTILDSEDIEKINEYQSKLIDLYEALNLIQSGVATDTDIDTLIDKFPELSDDTGDLETAIKSLINDALSSMNDIYGESIDNIAEFAVRQDALIHSINNTASAIDNVTSSYESLNNAIKEYNETGFVSLNTLEQIMKLEPKYLAALMDEEGNIVANTYAYRDLVLMRLRDYELQALKESNITNDKLKQDFENGSISEVEYNAGLKASWDDLMVKEKFVASAIENIDELIEKLGGSGSTSSTENTFDWIEVKINNITEAIEKLREVADDPFASWDDRSSALQSIITELQGNKGVYTRASEEYLKQANKVGLDPKYVKLIQEGAYKISSFKDDPNYDKIQEYKQWYDKYLEAKKEEANIDKEINSTNAELIENQDKQYQLEIAKLEAQKQGIQNIIDMNGGQGTADQYNILISYEEQILAQKEKQLSNAKEYLGTLAENSDEYLEQLETVHGLEDETAQIKKNVKDLELEKVNLVLDSIQDNIDDINEKIENQDRFISGAIGILNQEIEAQEGLRNAIQDQIDALQEENDEHERALALEKAKYELQRAQSQRNVKLYSGEDRGFIYTQDREAIRDAQQNLDQLEFEATIHALEKQKEYYDDIIADLSEIQDRWSNIASKAQEMLDIQYTLTIGGQGIRDSILGGTYDVDGLTNAYQELLGEQHSYEELEKLVSDLIAEFEDGTISVEECINQITTIAPQYANLLGTVVNTVLADIEALKGESSKATDSAEKDATDAAKEVTKATEEETESQTTLLSGFADTVKKTYSEVVSDIIKDMETQFQEFTKRLTEEAVNLKTTISETLSGIKKDIGYDGDLTVTGNTSISDKNLHLEAMATGGMLTGKDKKLDKLAHSLGEDHITMLAYKEGERVLTPYQNEVWEDLVQKASNFNFGAPNFDLFTPKRTNVPVNRVANSNQVTIGDIHLHEVQNVPDFAKALQKHLPNISVQYNGKH